MRNLGISLLLITICGALFASPAYAIDYGGIGIKPAAPQADNPRTESIFIHTIKPGETQEDSVMVVNNTATAKTLTLYSTDSTPSSDGGFACKQLLDQQTDVGTWIKLEKAEVTLAPTTSQTIKFTIQVPEGAPVGENDGCIVAQEKKAEAANDGTNSGIQLSLRTGLRIALTVPGELHKGLTVIGFDVSRNEKKVVVLHPSIKNTGNVSLDTDVAVVTRYWTGFQFVKDGGQYPILAGRTSEWNFELPKSFWGGLMISSVRATYDPTTNTELGKESATIKKTVKGPLRLIWLWPTLWGWLLDALILLVVLGLLWLLWLLKRQRNWMKRDWKEYKVKDGDNIVELGTKFNVNWRLIAMRNKLRLPYILTPGSMLFVPGEGSATQPITAKSAKDSTSKDLVTVLADKGDTLADVANYAGITVAELAKLNKIKTVRGYKVKSGQEFIIPNPDR